MKNEMAQTEKKLPEMKTKMDTSENQSVKQLAPHGIADVDGNGVKTDSKAVHAVDMTWRTMCHLC